MLVNAVIYTFPADRIDEVKRMLIELRDRSRAEDGCESFEVLQSNEDPNALVLYEVWRDGAALDLHYTTEHFARLGLNGIRTLATSRVGHRCTPL